MNEHAMRVGAVLAAVEQIIGRFFSALLAFCLFAPIATALGLIVAYWLARLFRVL